MTEITLTAATQSTLQSLRRTNAFINQAQKHPATRLKGNSPAGDALRNQIDPLTSDATINAISFINAAP